MEEEKEKKEKKKKICEKGKMPTKIGGALAF
jgi:hypothetical protein